MPDVVVRGLEPEVLDALKRRAEENGRPLQTELKIILQQAAQVQMTDARALAAKIRRSLSRRQHSDSAILLREDRQR